MVTRGWISDDAIVRARLLVSELVTNTVRHGDCRPDDSIDLRVERESEALRVEVCQRASVQSVEVARRKPEQEGGFGLALVDTLADEWGVQPEPPCVWFKLAAAKR